MLIGIRIRCRQVRSLLRLADFHPLVLAQMAITFQCPPKLGDPYRCVVTIVEHNLALLLDYPDAPEPWAPGLTVVPLGQDRIHLAAPTGSPYRPGTDLAELADETWIISGPHTYYGRAVRTACRRAGFEPQVRHRVDGLATALAMVANGLGVTLASDLGRVFCPPTGVDVVPFEHPLLRTVVLAHLPHAVERPSVRATVDAFARAATAQGLAAVG